MCRAAMILTETTQPSSTNAGDTGSYKRYYNYADLAPITGYTHGIYGQAGLEASLDEYLRGARQFCVHPLWNQLLYGMSPNGLDVRLSIDLKLQQHADEMMRDQQGAVILLNAQSGEIFVISSHPTFDPKDWIDQGKNLTTDPEKPLINRVTQGLYPLGSFEPFCKGIVRRWTLEAQYSKVYLKRLAFITPLLRMQVAQAFSNSNGMTST